MNANTRSAIATLATALAASLFTTAMLAGAGGAHAQSSAQPMATAAAGSHEASMQANGVVRVKSAYSVEESIRRVKADVAAKGILFFSEVDQSALAAKAGIALRPSTLLQFGNPPLGTQFITANPDAGLDWPVRLLITQDDSGQVWAVYSDFAWIARRHGIASREAQFAMASRVVESITSTLKSPL